jgi:hypothetical protein
MGIWQPQGRHDEAIQTAQPGLTHSQQRLCGAISARCSLAAEAGQFDDTAIRKATTAKHPNPVRTA